MTNKYKILMIPALALVASAPSAHATLFINEVLASTTSSDTEFFEIFNSGASAVDLTGYTFSVFESNGGPASGSFGSEDSLYTFGSVSVPAGGYFTVINAGAQTAFSVTGDDTLPDNFFENSASTYLLFDGTSNVDTVFMVDGDTDAEANINGVGITPNLSVGPDGSFFPAGFYRFGDGAATAGILEFSPIPAATATPGAANPVPEPSAYALLAGLACLASVVVRRRR